MAQMANVLRLVDRAVTRSRESEALALPPTVAQVVREMLVGGLTTDGWRVPNRD